MKETEWLGSNISNLSGDYNRGQHVSSEAYHAPRHPETHKLNVAVSMLLKS